MDSIYPQKTDEAEVYYVCVDLHPGLNRYLHGKATRRHARLAH